MKQINLNSNIYDLTSEYPEIIDIMVGLGFKDMANPFMLKTAGKVMTIPKGCSMKSIELSTVVKALEDKGFEVKGYK
jgi:hypothetical protein